MKKLEILFFCAVYLSIMVSCGSSKNLKETGSPFEVTGLECKHQPGEGIDSKVGMVKCGDIVLAYDLGKYGNSGPRTPKEAFKQQFDSYFYSQYFEKVYIDPKVSKLFLDSVEIVQVFQGKLPEEENAINNCPSCNGYAELKFKGMTHYFPFNVAEQQWIDRQSVQELYYPPYTYKLFEWEEGKMAAYIFKGTAKSRMADALAVSFQSATDLSLQEQEQILKKITVFQGAL